MSLVTQVESLGRANAEEHNQIIKGLKMLSEGQDKLVRITEPQKALRDAEDAAKEWKLKTRMGRFISSHPGKIIVAVIAAWFFLTTLDALHVISFDPQEWVRIILAKYIPGAK